MSQGSKIVPLIMCGGAGTRLWPASREGRPKQFLRLFGPLSTFQETVKRVSDPALFDKPIILTNNDYRFLVRRGARRDRHRSRDRARADAPRFRSGDRRRRRACRTPRSQDHRAGARRRPHRQRCRRLRCRLPRRAARAAAGGHIVTFGVTPDIPRPVTAISSRAVCIGGRVQSSTASRRSRMPRRPRATSRTVSVEQRQLHVPRRHAARRVPQASMRRASQAVTRSGDAGRGGTSPSSRSTPNTLRAPRRFRSTSR